MPLRTCKGVKWEMPIYEFLCLGCGHQFQSLVMREREEKELKCPKCQSEKLKKLISRVTYHASEKDRLASFDPASMTSDAFYKDTRNIGLAAKKGPRRWGWILVTDLRPDWIS